MPGDPHIPMPNPTPFPSPYPSPVTPPEPSPVPRPKPSPEPAPQPMPVPRPDPAPIPAPSPDPHPAPSPKARRGLASILMLLALACDLGDLGLPGTAPSTPRPTPNAAASGFDGEWTGTYSGTADVGGSTQPIQGPIAFVADDGVVSVSRPSTGAGRISPSGEATFSGSTSLAGLPVTCTFTGRLRVDGPMPPGECRCSSLAGRAAGTWTAERS